MIARLLPLTALTLALSLAGCQVTPASEPEPASVAEAPAPEQPTAPKVQPEAPEVSLIECDDQQRNLLAQPITAQTDAFVAGDYEGAYQMATPAFRQAVPLGAFEELITMSYGPLLQSTDLQFGDCLIQTSGQAASIDVRFNQGGVDVFGLRYVLQNTDEGWRIDGASALQLVGAGT